MEEFRGIGQSLKLYLTVYLCLWLIVANTVVCGWSARNSSARVGGVKIGERERGSGVKVGERPQKTNGTNRAILGVKIGDTANPKKTYAVDPSRVGKSFEVDGKQERQLKLGLLLPYKNFGFREYNKAIASATTQLKRGSMKLNLFRMYEIDPRIVSLTMTPSPKSKCFHFVWTFSGWFASFIFYSEVNGP